MRMRVTMGFALSLLSAAPAFAQQVDLTPFGGFRVGGGMEDYYSGVKFDIKDNWSYGGMLDVAIPGGRAVEFVYSHQGTEVNAGSGYTGPVTAADVNVDLWQLGLLQEKPLSPTVTSYGVGTLGITHFGFPTESADRFSIGFGGGAKVFPSPKVGLRLDARGYVTFVDTSSFYVTGGGGGAAVSFTSSALFQAEFLGGVVFRFGK